MPLIGGSLGELIVKIGTDITSLNAGLKQAEDKVRRSTDSIIRLTGDIGRRMAIMGAAITGTFALTVKAASDFESAFAGVRKTVDASEPEFKKLSDNLRTLATTIPTTAVELSKLTEIAGQLGVRGVDNLTKFAKTIALLGETTNISGEQASLQLTRLFNIVGEDIGNIDRLGSAVVDLGNNFAARESEIVDLSLSLASFGQQVGLSVQDVLAFSTIITASGGEAQAAGTAFQKMALTLKDAVITGNSDLKAFADIAGVTGEELVKIFKEDATEAIVLFIEGLNKINTSGGSVTQALEKIGLADQRLVREFSKVLNSTDDLREALDKSNKAWDENTALTIEAEKRFKTFESKIKTFRNNINDIAIDIGDALLPALNSLLEYFINVVKAIKAWSDAHPILSNLIIQLTVVIGLLVGALGTFLFIASSLIKTLTLLAVPVATMQGLLVTLGGVLVWIAGIGAAAFAGWKIGQAWMETFKLNEEWQKLFVMMFEWLDKLIKKWNDFWDARRGRGVLNTEDLLQTTNPNETMLAGVLAGAGTEGAQTAQTINAAKPVTEGGEIGVGISSETGGDLEQQAQEKIANIKSLSNEAMIEMINSSEEIVNIVEQLNNRRLQSVIATVEKELAENKTLDEKKRKQLEEFLKFSQKNTQLHDQIMQDSFDFASTLLNTFGQESVAAAIGLQAIRIAEVIIEGQKAIALIQSHFLPPVSDILAGKQRISTALQVATIAAQTFSQFAQGTDTVPSMLSPGEMVVPKTFADAIRKGELSLTGGDVDKTNVKNIVVNINLDNVNINKDIDIEEFAEQLGENIEAKLRSIS